MPFLQLTEISGKTALTTIMIFTEGTVLGVRPDILIEDDCKSIGGKWQWCISGVEPELKSKIRSIIVKEFRGIDHLPDLHTELLRYNK